MHFIFMYINFVYNKIHIKSNWNLRVNLQFELLHDSIFE